MKHGDFTQLAADYINRPGYSKEALDVIAAYIKKKLGKDELTVADVGAGTGKLTEELCGLGYSGVAVEPNDAMRAEGIKHLDGKPFEWKSGTAEETGLPGGSFDWVLMGSSFHWTEASLSLKEFDRILKPGGFFTAIWNPRDIDKNELHKSIEAEIYNIVPELTRVSSASPKHMSGMEEKLLSTPYFKNIFFVEAPFEVIMTKDRYMGVWRSVNDIQVQAGAERFEKILKRIEEIIKPLDSITVPYKARAWTVYK